MFSIIEQAGVQYKVNQCDVVDFPLLDAEPGAEITVDRVLLVADGDTVKVGTPVVDGAQVKASVVKHFKDDKVLVMKKHRRKDYKRKNGHRQQYTQVKIVGISA